MDSAQGIAPDTPAQAVAKLFADRDLVSAAVVTNDGRLLGRITIDDVVDVIREEAEHSVMSMAGLDQDEDMFAGVVTSARRRSYDSINFSTVRTAADAQIRGMSSGAICRQRPIATAVM